MDLLDTLLRCFASIVPVALITISGMVLCYKKWFDDVTNSQILKASTYVMLPLYILFALPKAYDSDDILGLWPLLICPLVVIPSLGVIGYICTVIINVPINLKYSISSVYCFSSIGNIGIIVIKSCCSSYGPLYSQDNRDKAIPYLCLMWLPFNILLYCIICPLFIKESKYTDGSTSNLLLKYLLSPLPVSAYVANIVGMIPGSIWFLFDKDSPGYMLTDSAMLVGSSGILFSQMVVGSKILINMNVKLKLDKITIAWIVLSRNVFVPGFVLGFTYMMWHYNAFGDDKVMAFVVFIGLSVPSSYMILIIMEQFKMEDQEVTVIILWIFITSFFTMTSSMYIFFVLIE